MDNRQLNLEIVLCRALVKRARVCVIRKLLKQIKILRSCKNEEAREKKLRKARRLVAEVHVMKKLRPDYVTKFALITENYVPTGSNTKLKRKRNACAKLAKHGSLLAKINSIRNKFSNWREELPPLLQSFKKKKEEEAVSDEAKIDKSANGDHSGECNYVEHSKESEDSLIHEKEPNKIPVGDDLEKCSDEEGSSTPDEEEEISESEREQVVEDVKSHRDTLDVTTKTIQDEPSQTSTIPKLTANKIAKKVQISNSQGQKKNAKHVLKNGANRKNKPIRKGVDSPVKEEKGLIEVKQEEKENGDPVTVEEKIEDPFFIGKKIVVPKLLQKGNENHPENNIGRKRAWNEGEEEGSMPRKKRNVIDDWGSRKEKRMEKREVRKNQPPTEDELHPSWKAKKMQTIKPFQGKIIKFE